MQTRRPHRQSGFTLLELAVTVVLLGIVGRIVGGYVNVLATLDKSAYNLEQNRISRLAADAMLEWAEYHNVSRLPAPYTDAGLSIRNGLVDPATTNAALMSLVQLITEKGLTPQQINSDGTNLDRVRTYQMVDNLAANVPFFGLSGGTAILRYQSAVVYSTACVRTDATCNRTTGDPPGDSPTLAIANLATWTTAGADGQPARINTLNLQRKLLKTTADRVELMREAFRQFFNAKQITGGPSAATTNFFPTGATSLAGANPVSNEGCHDGWYRLDPASGNTILAQIGLGAAEFGVTAWNGRIEYCRDYEPSATGTATAGQAPHFGAIRINPNLSEALNPGTTGNLVFSM